MPIASMQRQESWLYSTLEAFNRCTIFTVMETRLGPPLQRDMGAGVFFPRRVAGAAAWWQEKDPGSTG